MSDWCACTPYYQGIFHGEILQALLLHKKEAIIIHTRIWQEPEAELKEHVGEVMKVVKHLATVRLYPRWAKETDTPAMYWAEG